MNKLTDTERKARRAAYDKARRPANKEKAAARQKVYRERNKEQIAARDRAYRQANKEKVAARHKAYHEANKEAPAYRAIQLCTNSRNRARLKGIPFDLTREWIQERIESGKCAVTGIPFDLSSTEKMGGKNKYAPSLDRIDSSLGYTMDNVQVVIWQYNAAKAEYSDEDVMQMAEMLVMSKLGSIRGVYVWCVGGYSLLITGSI